MRILIYFLAGMLFGFLMEVFEERRFRKMLAERNKQLKRKYPKEKR